MKIMCLIKITCPLKSGIAPLLFAPTLLHATWLKNFDKYSQSYAYVKFDLEEEFHYQTQTTPYQEKTNHNIVLLFDSEEELNTWASNCRLTDPQLIADQETWKTAHGITFTYEYYSLSPTTGADPIL
jgi:hypothetical protein